MKDVGVGGSFFKGGRKIEGEVRLGQSFPSPMAITYGKMDLPEYLNGFALPNNRIRRNSCPHLPLGKRANMAQS